MKDTKILIVGAGVAGLTCSALLQRLDLNPTIIEKQSYHNFNSSGYMLGLLPLGGRVLNELGVKEKYFDDSIEMKNYEIHKEDGSLIKSFPLDFINEEYGSYRGITRIKLINILQNLIHPNKIDFNKTIDSIIHKDNCEEVIFSNGKSEIFDIVIIAEGLHSSTRSKILNKNEFSYFNTEWGGWVAWLNAPNISSYKEYWGASSFVGLYPVKDKIGVFLGGPAKTIEEIGRVSFVDSIKEDLAEKDNLLTDALNSMQNESDPFFWNFEDCRSEKWIKGNTILLGDAASGFLPTAGVGASMAMDSAAALVDELSRMDKDHIEYALELFVQRQKDRVEEAQKDSRDLAKIMFVKSKVVSELRDFALRFYTLENLTSNISKTLKGKI